jgi:bifunctional non-homologous end joining protein LigD
MLAASGLPPDGDGWALEAKLDGMRAQIRIEAGSVCIRSRPGRDCTDEFPELEPLAEALGSRQVLLDGELFCEAEDGRPDFERLRCRLRASPERAARHATNAPARFAAFDILHLDGRSTRGLPLSRRRELLEALGLEGPSWLTAHQWVGKHEAVLTATREHGLEGVVAKRLDQRYEPWKRSNSWLKHKHRCRERFLISGYVPSQPGQMESFTLLRTRADGQLEPAGSASFGLDGETREQLRLRLEADALPARKRNQRVRWVRPTIAATVD